ncbi:MAG: sensor histidine kinase, partial [Sphingopyxis sp.]|nr:sensor histidine kinase [Sphingopyxis sp.]
MLAEQRELLFAELQHRVSNNLQLVGSLLSVQKRGVDDPAARVALEQASLRLSAIGRISRELYHIDGAGEDIGIFLQRLAQAILEASGRTGDITISWQLERAITLDSKAILPLALVFTEALSNVLEHAYPNGVGPLDVTLRRLGDDRCELMLDDEGRGVAVETGSGPATLAAPGLSGPTSLGLRIAAQLAQQLNGSFTLTRRPDRPGSRARLDIAL